MTPLKALVRNGRILLDAATDLPEGEVQLVAVHHRVESSTDAIDGLSDDERAELDRALEASFDDEHLIDASDAIADLRSIR
jgi:hypothetical protein